MPGMCQQDPSPATIWFLAQSGSLRANGQRHPAGQGMQWGQEPGLCSWGKRKPLSYLPGCRELEPDCPWGTGTAQELVTQAGAEDIPIR